MAGSKKNPRKKKASKKKYKGKEIPTIQVDDYLPASKVEQELSERDSVESAVLAQIARYRKGVATKIAAKKKDVPDAPLSETLETEEKIPADIQAQMSAWHCIALLRSMAEVEPKRAISRNYFRNHGGIYESTWTQYFGTFEQFKRSAGVTLSRGAHRLGLQISKHAGADAYEKIAEEREKFRTKYERPSNKRYQTMVVGADFHDVEVDAFAFRVFVESIFRIQPEIVCLAGDLFDLYEFSKYTQDPREFDPSYRIQVAHKLLQEIREAAPDTQIDLIEGNHEMRLLRHLADATPALKTILSDLHGFSVPKLLGLEEWEVNYHGRGSLKARSFSEASHKRELARNWKVYYNCVMAHHFPKGQQMGMPGFHGHHHLHRVWPHFSVQYGGPYEWHQLGGMCNRIATYTDGERWSNGFMIVHVDTQRNCPNFEYVPVSDFAVVGGEFYEREDFERPWDDPALQQPS